MTMAADELEIDRLVRKLNYHESIILKILASSTCNTKIFIVKEKIEQFELLVHEIPDSQSDLFEEFMDKVVKLWDSYSAAASEAGHRASAPITTAYPQPTKTAVNNSSQNAKVASTPEYRNRTRSNYCGKDRKKMHRGFSRNCGDDHYISNTRQH